MKTTIANCYEISVAAAGAVLVGCKNGIETPSSLAFDTNGNLYVRHLQLDGTPVACENQSREAPWPRRGVVHCSRAPARESPPGPTARVYLRLVRLLSGPKARLSEYSSPRMSASVRCLLICGGGTCGGCADGADGGTGSGSQTPYSTSA
jgi:hypothetical protein